MKSSKPDPKTRWRFSRPIAILALLCVLLTAYAAVRYPIWVQSGVVWRYDRLTQKLCAISWSDSAPLCSERLALWLYRTGLWTKTEGEFALWQIDYYSDSTPQSPRILVGCDRRQIIHIGNRGSTLGLDNGHVYYVAPPDHLRPWLAADVLMKRHAWGDGAEVSFCQYRSTGGDHAMFTLDGEFAVAIGSR
jgi:hypothetical protein